MFRFHCFLKFVCKKKRPYKKTSKKHNFEQVFKIDNNPDPAITQIPQQQNNFPHSSSSSSSFSPQMMNSTNQDIDNGPYYPLTTTTTTTTTTTQQSWMNVHQQQPDDQNLHVMEPYINPNNNHLDNMVNSFEFNKPNYSGPNIPFLGNNPSNQNTFLNAIQQQQKCILPPLSSFFENESKTQTFNPIQKEIPQIYAKSETKINAWNVPNPQEQQQAAASSSSYLPTQVDPFAQSQQHMQNIKIQQPTGQLYPHFKSWPNPQTSSAQTHQQFEPGNYYMNGFVSHQQQQQVRFPMKQTASWPTNNNSTTTSGCSNLLPPIGDPNVSNNSNSSKLPSLKDLNLL